MWRATRSSCTNIIHLTFERGGKKLLGHKEARVRHKQQRLRRLNETGASDSRLFTDTASPWKLLTFKGSRRQSPKSSLTLRGEYFAKSMKKKIRQFLKSFETFSDQNTVFIHHHFILPKNSHLCWSFISTVYFHWTCKPHLNSGFQYVPRSVTICKIATKSAECSGDTGVIGANAHH